MTESQLHLQIVSPQNFLSHRTRLLGDIKSGNILANLNSNIGGALKITVVRAFGGQTHVSVVGLDSIHSMLYRLGFVSGEKYA